MLVSLLIFVLLFLNFFDNIFWLRPCFLLYNMCLQTYHKSLPLFLNKNYLMHFLNIPNSDYISISPQNIYKVPCSNHRNPLSQSTTHQVFHPSALPYIPPLARQSVFPATELPCNNHVLLRYLLGTYLPTYSWLRSSLLLRLRLSAQLLCDGLLPHQYLQGRQGL